MKEIKKSIKKHKVLLTVMLLLGIAGWIYLSTHAPGLSIKTYEECVASGNPVMESFPAQCRTPDGRTFMQPVKAPTPQAQKIRVKGTIVCLPHKDTSGPQTLECAHGLQSDEDGKYYGLAYTDPNFANPSALPTGEVAVIEGNLKEQNDSKYDVVGIIEVTSVQK